MYNLLMSSNEAAFDGSLWQLEKIRFGEHTEKSVYARFEKLDSAAFDELKSFPTLFWYETFNEKCARIGWIDDVRILDLNLAIKFSFDPFLPEIPFALVMAMSNDLAIDLKRWEGNRTHWAVKNVDLLEFLDEKKVIDKSRISPYAPYGRPARKAQNHGIVVRPQFFEVPSEPVDKTLVSVMMPFTPQFSNVYSAISEAAKSVGLRCNRADDIWNHSVLMQDIFGLIYRSHIVVCDFSGKNPNVFYEAGIAHTLGRHVVPITQSAADVPFDLQQHRYVPYLNNSEGLRDLTQQLASRLGTLARS
ncbi:hypothetical protein [Ensifer aridi]|uniref:hypothetical protein n=1 Tax=Ensifer aridi TaxID=1708715 RepID=UPI00358E44E6